MDEFQLRKGQFKLILMILICVSLAMILLTIIWEVNYHANYGFFHKVKAEVIEQQIGDNGEVYDILRYKADGVEYKIKADKVSEHDVGDKYSVFYDENNPICIIYSINYKTYTLPIIAMLFTIITLLLGLYYSYRFCNYKKLIDVKMLIAKKNKDVKN